MTTSRAYCFQLDSRFWTAWSRKYREPVFRWDGRMTLSIDDARPSRVVCSTRSALAMVLLRAGAPETALSQNEASRQAFADEVLAALDAQPFTMLASAIQAWGRAWQRRAVRPA